jgi:hypothetical protein
MEVWGEEEAETHSGDDKPSLALRFCGDVRRFARYVFCGELGVAYPEANTDTESDTDSEEGTVDDNDEG